MYLTRHERRVLAEVEKELQDQAPALAAFLDSWGADDGTRRKRPGLLARLLRRRADPGEAG